MGLIAISTVPIFNAASTAGAPAARSASPSTSRAALDTGQAAGSGEASAMSFKRVDTAVTQMLQNIGGGIENDAALKQLIALILLLALLQKSEGDQSSESSPSSMEAALEQLAAGLNSRSQSVAYFSSTTTTISIEQSSTFIFVSPGDAAATSANTGQGSATGAAPGGTELDVVS